MNGATVALSALVSPVEAFRSESIYRISRFALIAVMLGAVLASGILSLRTQPQELGKELLLARELDGLDALMLNAPQRQLEAARAQAVQQVEFAFGPAMQAVSVIAAPVRWFLLFVEIHLLLRLLTQFAGGEETPLHGRPHRRSTYLILVALLPLALSQLLAAGVVVASGTEVYKTVATYADYQRTGTLSLSLIGSWSQTIDSSVLRVLVDALANPFIWWSVYIFANGARPVLRLRTRDALIVAGVIIGLLSLQTGALSLGERL